MVSFSTSPIAAIGSVPPGGGPVNPGFIPATQSLNTRDILSGIIGKGFTDLKNGDARNAFAYLRSTLGPETAGKLMTHALLFNQRADMQGVDPQKKVQSFYDIGSNDPEVHNIIKRAGGVSYGPAEGLLTSPDRNNMDATGRSMDTYIANKDKQRAGLTTPLDAGASLLQKRVDNVRSK